MLEFALWIVGLVALPLVVVVGSFTSMPPERLRRLAIVCAAALLAWSTLPLMRSELVGVWNPWPRGGGLLLGPSLLRVDTLSSALVPLAAALWLLTVAVTPRMFLDRAGVGRTATATLITTISFCTESASLLAVLWLAAIVVYLAALSRPEHRRARRVAAAYLGASSVLLVAALLVLSSAAAGSTAESVGIGLLVVAALIRKGIFPFHAWVPEVFEHGRLGPAVLLSAPQLGTYVTAVLIVPHASGQVLRVIAVLSLVTAIYGASLALVQREARRACGYLFVSQSALVMAGLDCCTEVSLTGSLVLWISSALAFAGISRCVLVLEARRGRLDLTSFHGGYEQMPMLAVSFLVLGLACTGFPGTLGYIGAEMLVDGATETFPFLGFFVVFAEALTGLALLRMYFSLFCGRRSIGAPMPPRRAEAISFTVLAAFLIATGIVPSRIVQSRSAAAQAVVERREQLASLSSEPSPPRADRPGDDPARGEAPR